MEEFFKELKVKFQKQNPLELLSLKQTGTIVEYHDQFVFLLENVELFEGYAISLFLNGLKNAIYKHVKMFKPTTFQQAFVIAKFQEFILKKLHQESTTTLQQSLLPPNPTQIPKITSKHQPLLPDSQFISSKFKKHRSLDIPSKMRTSTDFDEK